MTSCPFTLTSKVKTRDGRKAGIYWIGKYEIHGWVESAGREIVVALWSLDGMSCLRDFNDRHGHDLILDEPDPTKLKVDDKVMVRMENGEEWAKRYFAKFEDGKIYAFSSGCTSWSNNDDKLVAWAEWRLPTEEELKQ